MQFFKILILSLCMTSAQAAPLVGYSTLTPANVYQIVNAKKETIFSAIADTVKRVELRDGFAVVQTSFNNVSLITEDKRIVVDAVLGSELSISKKLLSIYTPNGIGSVYRLDGTKIFPAADESQTRPVKQIWIANDRFAVIDRITNILKVYNNDGKELFTSNDTAAVLISDGYLVLKSEAGTLSIYNSELELLTTDSNATQVQISDQFAGYLDNNGNLRMFSREHGEFAPLNNKVSSFSLNNTFAMVNDSFGLTLYGKDKTTLETTNGMKSYAVSHELFAYVGNTGALWVKNEESEDAFVVNRADSYAMSDDLLIVKNGPADFAVYSLKKGSFGKMVHSVLDQSVARFQVGNGVVSFETSLQSGASNSAKVVSFSSAANQSVLVDEQLVNKVNLTVNREEWNWK